VTSHPARENVSFKDTFGAKIIPLKPEFLKEIFSDFFLCGQILEKIVLILNANVKSIKESDNVTNHSDIVMKSQFY